MLSIAILISLVPARWSERHARSSTYHGIAIPSTYRPSPRDTHPQRTGTEHVVVARRSREEVAQMPAGRSFQLLAAGPAHKAESHRASGVVRERSRRVRGVHCARTPRNQNTICGRNSSPLKIQHTIREPTRRRRPLQRHFFNAMPSPPSKRNRASGSDDDTATADGAGPAAEAAATGG